MFFFCICFLLFLPDWEEEQVSSPNILRLIYQGRFLHGNVTLGGEKTPELLPPREKNGWALTDMHTEITAVCSWKLLCCPDLFPEPQNRGTSVLWTSQRCWGRERVAEKKKENPEKRKKVDWQRSRPWEGQRRHREEGENGGLKMKTTREKEKIFPFSFKTSFFLTTHFLF